MRQGASSPPSPRESPSGRVSVPSWSTAPVALGRAGWDPSRTAPLLRCATLPLIAWFQVRGAAGDAKLGSLKNEKPGDAFAAGPGRFLALVLRGGNTRQITTEPSVVLRR